MKRIFRILSFFLVLFSWRLLIASPAWALNQIVRPDGDTATIQWTTTGTNHYDQIYEVVTQPTAGTTTDYVDNAGTATNVDRYTMGTVSTINTATAVNVWVYAYSSKNNSAMSIDLYWDSALQQNGSVTLGTSYAWHNANFTGLTLSQSQLDSLEIEITGDAGGRTYYVATLYADVTYTTGSLTVDIVDSGGSPVGSPSITMSTITVDFSDQTSTGTFGAASEKIRVSNTTATATWTLSVSASGGSTDSWDGAGASYDYNDPTANAGDGSDGDSLGGQMTVNPTTGTSTPQGGCTNTGISLGSSTAFNEETAVNSITLLSAGATADVSCYWDLTGVSISQTIPPEQPVDSYSIVMSLTVAAS